MFEPSLAAKGGGHGVIDMALLRVIRRRAFRGVRMRQMARRLSRAVSTISRELQRIAAARAGGRKYRATTAQWHANRTVAMDRHLQHLETALEPGRTNAG